MQGTIISEIGVRGKAEEGVEKRGRITGKRMKGGERWDKRLHIERISGYKYIH